MNPRPDRRGLPHRAIVVQQAQADSFCYKHCQDLERLIVRSIINDDQFNVELRVSHGVFNLLNQSTNVFFFIQRWNHDGQVKVCLFYALIHNFTSC